MARGKLAHYERLCKPYITEVELISPVYAFTHPSVKTAAATRLVEEENAMVSESFLAGTG